MQRPSLRLSLRCYFFGFCFCFCFTLFIKICMQTACWSPSGWYQHGGPKPTERYVTEFCYKSVNLSLKELNNIKIALFLIHELFRQPISQKQVTFSTNMTTLLAVIQMPRYAKSQKSKRSLSILQHVYMNSSFQLYLYIMKLKSQEDQLVIFTSSK